MNVLINAFKARTSSLEVIFKSYSSLHQVYGGVLKAANVPDDKLKLYDRTKRSADDIQRELSDALHTQAFILMTGSVEALLKDMLDDLILENFTKMNSISGVTFSIGEMKRILKGGEQEEFVINQLAESTIRQLNNVQNKSEMVNFQNTQSMQDILQRMFGISLNNLDAALLPAIHIYWQKRHALVHSDGIVDNRYINNTGVIGHTEETKGDKIVITKQIYDRAKQDFEAMFEGIEGAIKDKGLAITGLG